VDEKPIAITTGEAPASTKAPVAINEIESTTEESFSILQKGLFLAVILGCVAGYLRMNKKSKRFTEKSIV